MSPVELWRRKENGGAYRPPLVIDTSGMLIPAWQQLWSSEQRSAYYEAMKLLQVQKPQTEKKQ
ncbi:hypothetical protein KA082_01700 [Candidatus Woesebacteria bacterium]|nr:hypothetical protein [Candidatus Woesebacteria bacterium]